MNEVIEVLSMAVQHIWDCLFVIGCFGFLVATIWRACESYEDGSLKSAVGNGLVGLLVAVLGLLMSIAIFPGRAQGQCYLPTDTILPDQCSYIDAVPPIMPGDPVTKCYLLLPESDNVSPGYILVQSDGCGPISYTGLSYAVYTEDCLDLVGSGTLYPVVFNPSVEVVPGSSYVLCYSWISQCEQTAYCAGYNSSPLPVELLKFEGEATATSVLLRWATGSEISASKFRIHRASEPLDGLLSWKVIGWESAQGWSNSMVGYSFEDARPLEGWGYYRLESVDLDGSSEMSKVIPVYFGGGSEPWILYWYTLDGKRLR